MRYRNRPVVRFELAKFNDPTEITDWMALLNIQFYVYWFETLDGYVLKYGESGDCLAGVFGERIYRQAGHIPGWDPKDRLYGSSGSDMLSVLEGYAEENNKRLTKDNIIINVLPMSSVNSGIVKEVCERVERMMIDDHIELHGIPPVGNKDYVTMQAWRKHQNTKRLSGIIDFGDVDEAIKVEEI